ncbi:uncharacterized protein TM35_000092990 [Trypanosoma theileri]|uniref:Uncharacterized protein n=1 Tax=Trypanosoma theileri TaxID=67003 RepID=A0A1X0P146_9TRYP|nr:uncharacterized protein TM35_000092990 [Trypanosoma theileri]ORC90249.1 hypothetical protein TM35_000092990 [Trypanosoma theileri]
MIFQASRFSASGRKVPLEPRRSEACRPHKPHKGHSGVVQQHKVSFPLTIHTHTMTVSHAHVREALRYSLKCTLSHTPTERKRKTQEKNDNNRIPTTHKALTIQ